MQAALDHKQRNRLTRWSAKVLRGNISSALKAIVKVTRGNGLWHPVRKHFVRSYKNGTMMCNKVEHWKKMTFWLPNVRSKLERPFSTADPANMLTVRADWVQIFDFPPTVRQPTLVRWGMGSTYSMKAHSAHSCFLVESRRRDITPGTRKEWRHQK